MRKLTIIATKLDAEGNPYTSLNYEHEGEAFAGIKNGFVTIFDINTYCVIGKVRLSDYEDVTIYNY